MAITLKDVAKRAEVSLATASMAMGSEGRVSEETRRRVQAVAETMGYRPNMLVRGMQTGRTKTVGVLMNFASDAFEAQIFRGIHDALVKKGNVPIALMPTDEATVLDQMHSLLDRRVDGIVVRPSGWSRWETTLHEALDRNVPVVAVDEEIHLENGRQTDFVGTDDICGGRQAARAFLDAGHRNLAVVTAGNAGSPMDLRRRGFESELQDAGGLSCISIAQPFPQADVLDPAAGLRVLNLTPRPTGVFATMDMLALGVYRAAQELGLRIPQDLSVVGFSDEPLAEQASPPLSTLRQHPRKLGLLAAELLLRRIDQRAKKLPLGRTLVKPEWIARESMAAPRL